VRPPQQVAQNLDQQRTGFAKFLAMDPREMFENRLPGIGQPDLHQPPILCVPGPLDEAAFCEPVDQTDRAVMPDQKMSCKIAYRGRIVFSERPYGEQHLVLLGFQSFVTGSFFAEVQESPDLITEIGECAVIRRGQIDSTHAEEAQPFYIVLRY